MEIIKNVIYRVFAFVIGSLILCGCFSFYSSAADNESYDYYCKFTDVNQGKSINHANKSYSNAVNNTGQYTRLVLLKDATLQTSTGSGLDYYQYYVADYIDDSGYFQNHTYYKFSFKQMRYSDLAESSLYDSTSFDSTYLTDFYAGVDFPIETNIPIFENTEKGLADAKNYLETGTLPVKEGYDIYIDNLQVSDVIDDVVNITWDGYILDPALHSKSIVGYKVKRNVFPFIILSDGESDTGWQPWQSLPHYIDGKLKNADFIFSPSEPCPYKNGFAQLIVDLWPIVIDSDGQEYQGQKYSYYFDSDGNLQSVSKPTPSLDPIYDPDCYFENFYCSSSIYDKYGNLINNGTNLDSDKKHIQYFIGSNSVKRSFSPIREQGVYILCFFDGGTSSGYVLDLYSYGSLLSGGGFQFQPTLGELNIYFGLDNVPLSDSFNKKFTLKFIPYYSTGSSLYYGNASVVEINGSDIHPFQEHNDPADENSDKDREDLDPEEPKKNPIDYIGGDVSGGDSIDVLTVTKNFYSMLTGMLNALGQFPSLVARVFSFLPSVYTDMLLVALALVIILRILGR